MSRESSPEQEKYRLYSRYAATRPYKDMGALKPPGGCIFLLGRPFADPYCLSKGMGRCRESDSSGEA